MPTTTLYDRVGGQPFFDDLVASFYVGVELNQALRAMYPTDLEESKRHLALFLAQYWGGPTTYGELRGHPRLRLRHAPFAITSEARDGWLACMLGSLGELRDRLSPEDYQELEAYLETAAHQLRNH